MVEGFYEDVIQILKKGEMAALQKYAKENALPIDMDSLENGTGVLIIHDHKLSPQQEKAAALSSASRICCQNGKAISGAAA